MPLSINEKRRSTVELYILEQFQNLGYQKHGRKKDQYDHRAPTNDVVERFIHILAHNFLVVNQQDHTNQKNGQKQSIDNLRP